jgi:curved DNA-binding protein CbpA
MSAPLAGKFQDHYEVLAVDPKTDLETIQSVYGGLAQKYHPNNIETGDQETFEAVNLAYEILSDPVLRKEFDKIKGIGSEESLPKFSGLDFFVSMGREAGLRSAILCVLYDRRRTNPLRPSLSMRHLEMMLGATNEELFFALWYLKQRHLVSSDDKSSLQITVEGMDFLESNRPSPEIVMPLIKPAGVGARKFPAQAILHVASAPELAPAIQPGSAEAAFLEALEAPRHSTPPERTASPEASSALKALREALAGAAGRVTTSH